MKLRLILLAASVASESWAQYQPSMDRASLGQMIDNHGLLRAVSGVSGSFVVSPVKAKEALATACSRTVCVAKLEHSILGSGVTLPAPAGPALIAADSAGATIYFAGSGQFARFQAGVLTPIDLSITGEVVSLRSTAAGVQIAMRGDDGIRIVSADGGVLDSLPLEATAALLLSDGVVYATGDALVLRRADGSEQRFAAKGVQDLFIMGPGWVEARASAAIFALRTDAGRESLHLLPQPAAGIAETRR